MFSCLSFLQQTFSHPLWHAYIFSSFYNLDHVGNHIYFTRRVSMYSMIFITLENTFCRFVRYWASLHFTRCLFKLVRNYHWCCFWILMPKFKFIYGNCTCLLIMLFRVVFEGTFIAYQAIKFQVNVDVICDLLFN